MASILMSGLQIGLWTPFQDHPCITLQTLSLKVSDLLVEHTNFWNLPLLRRTFAADDVDRILSIKAKPHLRDSKQWGFNPYGSYTS